MFVVLDRVKETLGLVAETLPRVRLPDAPLAVKILVVLLLPASKMPVETGVKLMEPLLAVMSTLEPSESGPATFEKVIPVADATSPRKVKSSTCEN